MARYFGDFLISRKVVTSEQVVQALCDQVERQRPLAVHAWEEKCWSPEDFLKIFDLQQTQGHSFAEAVRNLGLDNSKFQNSLDRYNSQRVPLGEILVEKGWVDLKSLIQHLDEFLAQPADGVASDSAAVSGTLDEAQSNLMSEVSSQISGADVSTQGVVGVFEIPPDTLLDLSSVLDHSKLAGLRASFDFFKDNHSSEADLQMFRRTIQDMQALVDRLAGCAAVANLEFVSGTFAPVSEVLSRMANGTGQWNDAQSVMVLDYLQKCLGVLDSFEKVLTQQGGTLETVVAQKDSLRSLGETVVMMVAAP